MRTMKSSENLRAYKNGRKIVSITAYDYFSARYAAQAEVDFILVGDSLGCVIKGEKDTKNVTIEEVAYHTRCVRKGAPHMLIAADLPINTYRTKDDALKNSKILIQAGADLVKPEGYCHEVIECLIQNGFRVIGHLGFTAQHFDSPRVLGKNNESYNEIIAHAKSLDSLGIEVLILECIVESLAATLTKQVGALTIGIGAGAACDGQILVFHDVLGFDVGFKPRFLKKYRNMEKEMIDGIKEYRDEVINGEFPKKEYTY